MDSYKLAVKFFVRDPAGLNVREFVPVFHRWIQTRALPEHQLIDVADYSHVKDGPGTVLVAHEANIHADLGRGRLGLLYLRKQPLSGSFHDRLRATFGHALRCVALLEEAPELGGRVRFDTGEAEFRIADRLLAPNTPQTCDAVRPELQSYLQSLYGTPGIKLAHPSRDAGELFEVNIRAPESVPASALLSRAASA